MDEQTFQRKMAELIERIKELPERQGTPPRSAAESPNDDLKVSVEELQESLDYLRLSVKYLVFDLEATRRENTYLRRLVEQANHRDDEPGRTDDHFE